MGDKLPKSHDQPHVSKSKYSGWFMENHLCRLSFMYRCVAAPKFRLYAEQDGKPKFHWTDIEVELLLIITHKYKVKKSTERIIWESIIRKYNDILVLFQRALPSTPGNACGKDYPHKPDAVNKSNLSTTV